MKNFLYIFTIILFSAVSLMASNNPANPVTLITTAEVNVSIEDNAEIFLSAGYDANRENFEFITEENISFIQIFNPDGDLEFQLPVMSNKVKIGKSIFSNGEYQLGFMIDGKKSIQFTKVTIK